MRGDGVVLTYNLFPAQRVRRIVFDGTLGLPESDLRRIIVERHGASPSLARSSQAVATLQALYRDRGYPNAEIAVRAGDGADPSNVSMMFSIRPGVRARIGAIDVQGRRAGAGTAGAERARSSRRRRIRRRRARCAAHPLCERLESRRVLRGARGSASSIRRWRCFGEPRAEHRAWTSRRDRLSGRSACRKRPQSPRAHRARAFGGRRPARGFEVRHRAPLPRARLLQSAGRLPARRCRADRVKAQPPCCA